MKISFFIGGMYRGGAERVISILANHYSEKGWDVDIVLMLYSEVHYELDKRINIVNMVAGQGSYFMKLPKWLRLVRHYLREVKPDRVVSFIGRINMVVLTAALGLKIPIIVSERNDPKHDGRGRLIQAYSNCIYKTSKSIVYQTEYEKSCFSSRLTQGCIIPNPITVYAEPTEHTRKEIVTAGRLLPQKNQKLLIDAFAEIHKEFPECTLKIYGSGNLKDELQDQIDNMGLGDIVQLCGNIPDLHKKISGAAIFALTSEFEGLSNALIEAMTLGIPCVSTDYPGSNEIVKDGYNGFIVPRNDKNALVKAIKRIFENPTAARMLGKNAICSAELYKKERVILLWESVIER